MADLKLCDRDCNNCEIIGNDNSRMVTFILNSLVDKFGFDRVYPIVQGACPNLTCCFDCRIDDFCHIENCEIIAKNSTAMVVDAARYALNYLTDNLDNGGCEEIAISNLRESLDKYDEGI